MAEVQGWLFYKRKKLNGIPTYLSQSSSSTNFESKIHVKATHLLRHTTVEPYMMDSWPASQGNLTGFCAWLPVLWDALLSSTGSRGTYGTLSTGFLTCNASPTGSLHWSADVMKVWQLHICENSAVTLWQSRAMATFARLCRQSPLSLEPGLLSPLQEGYSEMQSDQ